ncbi:hypothetical protein AOR_1_806014 [Paecilomyces variotii No. 5]|uniref:INO80 complex subunit F domain-containing protein n=1 Tax=Byssochlamys spectabilis (strain No. 5 / NBRC 109023) TaxID=1356009 RepID=V5G114_BYSSN|nr:hypothetical protein AOR_1_806014 [Paecilomyces variotii No. 5]
MESNTTTSVPPPNPPSVEAAYKRKCIALKKRLNEIEAENELMRVRNQRGLKYVQKMRLESCILLERLAKVTGMQDEAQAGVSPELRARAAALMSNAAALNGAASNAGGDENGTAGGYLDDETEGSSDEQPPTPQERPLRIKRSRKSNGPGADAEGDEPAENNDINNNTESAPGAASGAADSSLPAIAPAPSQEELTSSFRVRTGSNGSATQAANNDNNTSNGTETTPAPADSSTAPPPHPESSSAMDVDTKEEPNES